MALGGWMPAEYSSVLGNGWLGGLGGVRDVVKCRQCKTAAMAGGETWNDFCRSLPTDRERALCWSKALESKVNKSNWCPNEYCN